VLVYEQQLQFEKKLAEVQKQLRTEKDRQCKVWF